MPPKTRAALRGMRGFNALDDTTEGPRASFSRSSGTGGPKGRIAGPQSSQSSSERRIGTSFRDTRVKLIGFRLTEVVQIWFTNLKHYRSLGFAPFTREEFTQAFMERFLPESVRDAKAQEFETLIQAPGMTVSDYDIQFTQLSSYAPYLV
ncbi:Retrotransposon gag domain - like 10 [Theobroma cacao]|nr:Retrotransposon gag domain - like 10 [Theobroma cacao]